MSMNLFDGRSFYRNESINHYAHYNNSGGCNSNERDSNVNTDTDSYNTHTGRKEQTHTHTYCPHSFSRSDYIRKIIQREKGHILCCVLSTFSLDLYAIADELPDLISASSDIDCLIVYNKKVHTVCKPKCGISRKLKLAKITPQYQSWSRLGLHQEAKVIMGVHHSKYMLIFCRSGVYTMISTANLTNSDFSSNLTWSQFFPLRRSKFLDMSSAENDFGIILQDFLTKQSQQVNRFARRSWSDDSDASDAENESECNSGPMEFIRLHSGLPHDMSLAAMYEFEQAEVRLVSTVPGRRLQNAPSEESSLPCMKCMQHRASLRVGQEISYGAARICEVLMEEGVHLSRELTSTDTLIMQPTSIGSGTCNQYIVDLLSMYMPETGQDKDTCSQDTCDMIPLESVKLVWPSAQYITEQEKDIAAETSQQGLFFLPRYLALMEPDLHAQMHLYEGRTCPCPRLSTSHLGRVPHEKTYLRMMPDTGNNTTDNRQCSCKDVAWLLLTSACLSKGAQGEVVEPRACRSCGHMLEGCIEYKNFELGVLFHTRNKGTEKRRVYRILDSHCPVHGLGTVSQKGVSSDVIILPLPYEAVRTKAYLGSNGEFLYEPYFHDPSELPKYNGQIQINSGAKNGSVTHEETAMKCPAPRPLRRSCSFDSPIENTNVAKRVCVQTSDTVVGSGIWTPEKESLKEYGVCKSPVEPVIFSVFDFLCD
mmetsp:Transcript_20900/g.30089  ORF Transcript_20900/g.30089 Transcript_20900/m.30089 type:complete len:707 (-) Transcript_20900:169-2289(-)